MRRLEDQVRSDKVMVAFVAEFSRGKSELINAIFFAGYGRRIMPASAGRTTMCPTEIGYDPEQPPCLRLLPIETRLEPLGLAEWRLQPKRWSCTDLDMRDAAQLARALEKVAEVRKVSPQEARALGFWHDDLPDENPLPDAQGKVEVPLWRHAVINMPHPLLKQGLVILDTPGLNAVGAEPELTVNLIPQAQAVVFILGADTGVTRSDLAIWREHLAVPGSGDARLVVLNKIDTLWNSLNTPAQVQVQVERQRATSAEMLGLPVEQVLAVSAQKGLEAKIAGNAELLQASGLPMLEDALGHGVMGRRQAILRAAVAGGMARLRDDVTRIINIRRRDLDDQMVELRGLRGKNATVVHSMRGRIEQEQREFDQSTAKIHAVQAVHMKLLREVFKILSGPSIKLEMAELTNMLAQRGVKFGARKAYALTFERLRACLGRAETSSGEIHAMLGAAFRQLNAEFGFSLQSPGELDISRFLDDLAQVEKSHLQYLGVGNALKLAQPEFAQRLVRALGARLRVVFESAANEMEIWSKAATAQVDAQLRERRRSFARRLEAIDRIQHAANGLSDRIGEIEGQETQLVSLEARMRELTEQLLTLPAASEPPKPSGTVIDILLPA
ncbi:MAG TPA: dynamin family protein [Burkholderiaceae bacterium]